MALRMNEHVCVFISLYYMLLITTVTSITAVATTLPILLMLLREYYKYCNTNSRANSAAAADYHYRSANWADAVPRPAVVISKVCPGTVNSLWREPQSG